MPKIFQRRRAAASNQYALVVGLIAVIALSAVTAAGVAISRLFTLTSNQLTTLTNGGSSSGSGSGGGTPGATFAVAHINSPYLTLFNTSDYSTKAGPAITPTGSTRGVAYRPDGSMLAVTMLTAPYVRLYDANLAKLTDPAILPTGGGHSIAFSSDGSLFAIAHFTSPYVTIYNSDTRAKLPDPPSLPTSNGWGIAFSSNGLMAVGLEATPYIAVYNTSTWARKADPAILPPDSVLGPLSFSPDGSLLAVPHNSSPCLTVYQTATMTKVSGTPALSGDCLATAFSPNGSYLAVGRTGSPYISVLNTNDWSIRAAPASPPAFWVRGVAFSPDSSRLNVLHDSSPNLRVYNVTDMSLVINTLSAGTAYWGAFSPN